MNKELIRTVFSVLSFIIQAIVMLHLMGFLPTFPQADDNLMTHLAGVIHAS